MSRRKRTRVLSNVRSRMKKRFRLRPLFGQIGDIPDTTVVYEDFLLKCESWETGKRDSRTIPVDLVDLTKTELVYNISFVRGDAPLGNARYTTKIWVNDILYVEEDMYDNPRFQQEASGTVDITGIPTEDTKVEIGMTNAPGQWGQIEFSVDLVNYYPAPPPPQKTLTIGIKGGGYTTPGAGSYDFDEGSVVDVTATAYEGHEFAHWLRGTYVVSKNRAISVIMDINISLTAVFKEKGKPDPPAPEPECSLDKPCPPGYECIDGVCVEIPENDEELCPFKRRDGTERRVLCRLWRRWRKARV